MASVAIHEALRVALAHHQANRVEQAAEIYGQILAQEPRHPDALHLLGMCHFQAGQHQAAVDLIAQAIEVQPNTAVFHRNRALVLKTQGRGEEAAASYRHALSIEPNDAGTWFEL